MPPRVRHRYRARPGDGAGHRRVTRPPPSRARVTRSGGGLPPCGWCPGVRSRWGGAPGGAAALRRREPVSGLPAAGPSSAGGRAGRIPRHTRCTAVARGRRPRGPVSDTARTGDRADRRAGRWTVPFVVTGRRTPADPHGFCVREPAYGAETTVAGATGGAELRSRAGSPPVEAWGTSADTGCSSSRHRCRHRQGSRPCGVGDRPARSPVCVGPDRGPRGDRPRGPRLHGFSPVPSPWEPARLLRRAGAARPPGSPEPPDQAGDGRGQAPCPLPRAEVSGPGQVTGSGTDRDPGTARHGTGVGRHRPRNDTPGADRPGSPSSLPAPGSRAARKVADLPTGPGTGECLWFIPVRRESRAASGPAVEQTEDPRTGRPTGTPRPAAHTAPPPSRNDRHAAPRRFP